MMLVRGLGRDPTVSAGHRHHGVAVWAFAVLLALAGTTAPAASAATGIATETRVGAIDHPAPVSVGSEAPESSTGIGVGTVGFEACVAAAATTTGGSTPEQGYDGAVAQRVDVVTETPFDRARVLRSSVEVVSGAERNRGALSDADARFATNSADDVAGSAFHHTTSQAVDSISSSGLNAGGYATPVSGLSPLQAHIELALNPANGARNAVLEIDLAGLRSAGYEIPQVTRVTGAYNMPGGGYEMQFPYKVPPEFIKVIQR